MAFITDTDLTVLNIRLTTKGREQLSKGKLKFKKFAIGDSEINYQILEKRKEHFENINDGEDLNKKILKPVDLNPEIISFIKKSENSDVKNELQDIPSYRTIINNQRSPVGCFIVNEETNEVAINDTLVSGVATVNSVNNKVIELSESFEEKTFLLAKNNDSFVVDTIEPYIFYRIESVSGNNHTLDRPFNGSGYVFNFRPKIGQELMGEYPSDYVFPNEEMTVFFHNFSCEIARFPYWMLSILFTENIPGVDAYPDNDENGDKKSFLEFKTTDMAGFVNYIQNHNPVNKTLAVIHYTNPSPANTYGEGFYEDTTEIFIPTIMWHRPGNKNIDSSEMEMGLKLNPVGPLKRMNEENPPLNIDYYDMADQDGYIVGKIFTGLKIVLIEDEELIFALSYKSNRSWTLSKPMISILETITED